MFILIFTNTCVFPTWFILLFVLCNGHSKKVCSLLKLRNVIFKVANIRFIRSNLKGTLYSYFKVLIKIEVRIFLIEALRNLHFKHCLLIYIPVHFVINLFRYILSKIYMPVHFATILYLTMLFVGLLRAVLGTNILWNFCEAMWLYGTKTNIVTH